MLSALCLTDCPALRVSSGPAAQVAHTPHMLAQGQVSSQERLCTFPGPPPQILMSRPREEWKQDVMARYKALSQFSKEDARVQYLRIIRSLPYGQ